MSGSFCHKFWPCVLVCVCVFVFVFVFVFGCMGVWVFVFGGVVYVWWACSLIYAQNDWSILLVIDIHWQWVDNAINAQLLLKFQFFLGLYSWAFQRWEWSYQLAVLGLWWVNLRIFVHLSHGYYHKSSNFPPPLGKPPWISPILQLQIVNRPPCTCLY